MTDEQLRKEYARLRADLILMYCEIFDDGETDEEVMIARMIKKTRTG